MNYIFILIIFSFTACKGTAKLMYTSTLALGCKAFQDAQKAACKCSPRDELWWLSSLKWQFYKQKWSPVFLFCYAVCNYFVRTSLYVLHIVLHIMFVKFSTACNFLENYFWIQLFITVVLLLYLSSKKKSIWMFDVIIKLLQLFPFLDFFPKMRSSKNYCTCSRNNTSKAKKLTESNIFCSLNDFTVVRVTSSRGKSESHVPLQVPLSAAGGFTSTFQSLVSFNLVVLVSHRTLHYITHLSQ